jgi:hypothetical protein
MKKWKKKEFAHFDRVLESGTWRERSIFNNVMFLVSGGGVYI